MVFYFSGAQSTAQVHFSNSDASKSEHACQMFLVFFHSPAFSKSQFSTASFIRIFKSFAIFWVRASSSINLIWISSGDFLMNLFMMTMVNRVYSDYSSLRMNPSPSDRQIDCRLFRLWGPGVAGKIGVLEFWDVTVGGTFTARSNCSPQASTWKILTPHAGKNTRRSW